MRKLAALAACCLLPALAAAGRPDPAVYPNANVYRDPAIAAGGGFAKVIREFCPGGGRGLVHFRMLDGHDIRVPKTWPTYLEVAPGPHRLGMEFKGPAATMQAQWQGDGDITADLAPGRAYLVRYERTGVDAFRVWLEPYEEAFDRVGQATSVCRQGDLALRS